MEIIYNQIKYNVYFTYWCFGPKNRGVAVAIEIMVKRIATLNNYNKGTLNDEQFNFKLIFVIRNKLPDIPAKPIV